MRKSVQGSRLLTQYGSAVLAVALAAWVQGLLWPWITPNRLPLFYPVVIFTAWYLGFLNGKLSSREHFHRLAASSERTVQELLRREQRAHAEAEAERKRISDLLSNAPAFITAHRGPGHVYEYSNRLNNETFLQGRVVIGKPLAEAIADDPVLSTLAQLYDQVYATGTPFHTREFPLKRDWSGKGEMEEKYFDAVLQPTYDSEGRIDGTLSFTVDVTEKVLARRGFQQSARQIRQITDGLPALIAYLDPQGKYLVANKAYHNWFGLREDEVVGRHLREVLGDMAMERIQPCVDRVLLGETVKYQARVPYGEDQERDIDATYLPDLGADGRVNGFTILILDITEQKRIENALKDAVRARDEFLSIASHELNTPLTSIKLQMQMRNRSLERGDLSALSPEKINRMISLDNRQIDRFTRLIGDMLDISRINTGRLAIHPERADLGEICQEVIERYSPQLEAAGYKLTLERCDPTPGYWDRFRLEQVIANLLTNAMRYGKRQPVSLSVIREGAHAKLRVRDRGIGIDPKDHDRIFQKFERAVSPNVATGLGLGLYIVRQIIEMHGGSIRVESEIGKGSTFVVTLPLEEKRLSPEAGCQLD